MTDALGVFDAVLKMALSHTRPEGSRAQWNLRGLLANLAGQHGFAVEIDTVGNLIVDNGGTTVWTAHTDTVAASEAFTGLDTTDSRCWTTHGQAVMGADDGAGVAVLAGLLAAGVPGLYCWTVDEERGARGARHLAETQRDRLRGYSRAVAFDRKGTADIVFNQLGSDMASEMFVQAVADALDMCHTGAVGVFTDNAEFHGLIPEIVNISCGYEHNHSKHETLDYAYLRALFLRVLTVDWESLPTVGVTQVGAEDELLDLAYDLAERFGLGEQGNDFNVIYDALLDAYNIGRAQAEEAAWRS